MANWQRTIDISDAWKDADPDDFSTIKDLVDDIIERLSALEDLPEDEELGALVNDIKQDLIEDFTTLNASADSDVSDFDDIMERLYDWGDMALDSQLNGRKVCWIKTF